MDQILKKQIPLDIGTINVQVAFEFVPNGMQESVAEHRNGPITLSNPSTVGKFPATDNQKRALAGMARRLGRQIELERLSKSEASNLIDEMGAELRRRQNTLD
jgi:hypothetical protein